MIWLGLILNFEKPILFGLVLVLLKINQTKPRSYIYNFIIRWGFRIVKKVQYPGIMNYGKHKELNAYTIDNYERLIYEYHICKARKVPFVIYTHYWQLNTDEKAKKLIKQIYNYVIKDGAEIVPLSECFK